MDYWVLTNGAGNERVSCNSYTGEAMAVIEQSQYCIDWERQLRSSVHGSAGESYMTIVIKHARHSNESIFGYEFNNV